MNYINTTTLEYPLSSAQIKRTHPNTSFPSPFEPGEGYAAVAPSPQPSFNPLTHAVAEVAPVLLNGYWTQQWEVQALDPAAAAANLTALRAAYWEDIKAIRDRKTQQGGYKVGADWFHSDTFSRTQQIGLTMYGANMPADLTWKTMSGTFVPMTPTLAQQIFAAAGAQDVALFTHAETLKAQVEAATDPTTVDITAGWPETFGGI